ncbi:MAG TPA: V-type ATP synthase subunit E [Capillibacterium sp.]
MAQELTELTNRILEAARKEAEEIKERSREEARRLAAEYRQATAEKADAIRKEYLRRGQEEADRIIREAEMDAKLRLLQTKQELIHHAFEEALSTLANLPAAEKSQLYQDLLLAAVESGEETIAVSAADKEIWTKVVAQVNQELRRKGLPGDVKLSEEPAAIKGGFLLAGSTYEVNASLESILSDLEDKFFPEVAGILFS